jgi:uncharacterized membrane protein YhaH (DUF805 family)
MSVRAVNETDTRTTFWVKVLVVTVLVAILAFMLGPIIWPPAEGSPSPTATQIPFLLFLSLVQATVLGLGVSFLAFGLPVMRRISPDSKVRAWAMYLSITYLVISWWPHTNMHVHNGTELQGMIYIDYLFHLPSMIAALVLAYGFFSLLRESGEMRKSVR